MIDLFRNLDRRTTITVVATAFPLIWFSIEAWRGDHLALALLIFFSFIWLGMAVLNGLWWRSTIKDWRISIDGWGETHELLSDTRSLLIECMNSLNYYDEEKAEEIRLRANVITALRIRNMEEKERKA